jgi:hypothetical protein
VSPIAGSSGWGGTRRIGLISTGAAPNAAAAAVAKAFPSPRTFTSNPEKSGKRASSIKKK